MQTYSTPYGTNTFDGTSSPQNYPQFSPSPKILKSPVPKAEKGSFEHLAQTERAKRLDKAMSMDTAAPGGFPQTSIKKTVKEITYMEEDNSPDYLLPSNGGYNPKQKSMYVEEEEEEVVEVASPESPSELY